MRLFAVAALIAAILPFSRPADAGSLRVAPVLIDLTAPTATSSVHLWNESGKAIHVQVRIFRWSQIDGRDAYTPTTDVVASPPMLSLKQGGENIVRIVRTSKKPVAREESYRLIIDELPSRGTRRAGTIMLLVRQSIPVFFSSAEGAEPAITWSVSRPAGGFRITARNSGGRRLKISDLALTSGATILARQAGLVGYALGGSTVSWFVPAENAGKPGGSVRIKADSEAGPFDATAQISGR